MKLKINGIEVKHNGFFFHDGCHKIYVIEDEKDIEEMKQRGWGDEDIYPIEKIEEMYVYSCPLRFIDNAKLTKFYAPQCEDAYFEWED